jgi:hypothetical protein
MKNKMGPAISLSSIMCWSILPNGLRTASVCLWSAIPLLHYAREAHTFILICPKFTPSSSTAQYQCVVRAFASVFTNIAVVHPHICIC